ncbi:hypothetical protein ACFCW2_09645 [Qipengyuania sp. DSG2-2]|uniref:hypothetical protein n=1 Tax=Qipengyuania sp. DGS2-2 TaxID=3349631 RepID=UPI0036D34AC0
MRKALGATLALIGLIILGLSLLAGAIVFRSSATLGDTTFWLLAGCGLFTFLGGWLNKFGRQLKQEPGERFLARHDGPIVTYLRSFGADSKADTVKGIRPKVVSFLPESLLSEEEQVALAFDEIAPMVAIGRPGEMLPQLGAYRVYTDDDSWQDMVHAMLDRSSLVVMRAGETEGFWWEVANVSERVPPERVIYLLPAKEKEYEAFRTRFAESAGIDLPNFEPALFAGSFSSVLWFTPDGAPHIARPKFSFTGTLRHPVAAALREMLSEPMASLGVAQAQPATAKQRALATAADFGFFIATMLVGFALAALTEWQGFLWLTLVGAAVVALLEVTPLRASPGKLMTGLVVKDASGIEARGMQIVGRSSIKIITVATQVWYASLALVILGKRSLHDLATGAEVYFQPSRKR